MVLWRTAAASAHCGTGSIIPFKVSEGFAAAGALSRARAPAALGEVPLVAAVAAALALLGRAHRLLAGKGEGAAVVGTFCNVASRSTTTAVAFGHQQRALGRGPDDASRAHQTRAVGVGRTAPAAPRLRRARIKMIGCMPLLLLLLLIVCWCEASLMGGR